MADDPSIIILLPFQTPCVGMVASMIQKTFLDISTTASSVASGVKDTFITLTIISITGAGDLIARSCRVGPSKMGVGCYTSLDNVALFMPYMAF